MWGRLAPAALIRPLAQELPYAAGLALKRKKKEKKRKGKGGEVRGRARVCVCVCVCVCWGKVGLSLKVLCG